MKPFSSYTPPFSYSGGKSQLAPQICGLFRKHFPNESHIISPFLGGGAVELRWMHNGGTCLGADVDPHVVLLWKWLIEAPREVAECAAQFMPIDIDTWHDWYSEMMSSEWHLLAHAAKYFILRYTKVVHAFSPWEKRLIAFNAPKVYLPAFHRLAQFRAPRLDVECADFRDFLNNHDSLAYLSLIHI